MIFIDQRRDEYWRRVRLQLEAWAEAGYKVLDVACGFGKFAPIFDPSMYVGVDFSSEMLKIARAEHPGHTFDLVDAKDGRALPKVDVVFEINSLKSLGLSAEDFIKRFSPYAKLAVASLEADEFRITQFYPQHRR